MLLHFAVQQKYKSDCKMVFYIALDRQRIGKNQMHRVCNGREK